MRLYKRILKAILFFILGCIFLGILAIFSIGAILFKIELYAIVACISFVAAIVCLIEIARA